MIKRYLLITAILVTTNIFSFSQSVTNSPYTMFGIGEIDRNGFNHSKAMGGISTGLRTRNQINYMNPAAISAQDTMSFIFDIGITGISKNLESSTENAKYEGVSFDHIAMSFPIKKWWYSSLGITPYSKMGYNIIQTSPYEYNDTLDMHYLYYGNGGINQLFFSNAFKINEHFNIGFNANYMFGTLEQYNQISLNQYGSFNTIIENKITLKKFSYDLGIQYYNTFTDNLYYVLGLVYSNKINIEAKNESITLSTEYYDFYNQSIIDFLADYTSYTDTISASTDPKYKIDIPAKYSIGFTIGKKDNFVLGVDYSYQDWSDIKSLNPDDSFDTDQTIRFGVEYIPNFYALRNYMKKISYRAGFYHNNSYLKLNNQQINNSGITFGLGFPIGNQRTSLNMSYTLGKRGTTNNGLIEENYSSFGINLTLYDFWFIKRKFQ